VTIVAGKTAIVRQELKALPAPKDRRSTRPLGHGGAGVEQTVDLKANETTVVRASGTH